MNDKIKLVPSYTIKRNVDYAFTISPKADLTVCQCESTLAFLYRVAQMGVIFNLFPELTDKSRNLHWHGTIRFASYFSIMELYDLIRDYREDFAIEIDTIGNWYWYVYCRKSRHIMNKFMLGNKLPSAISSFDIMSFRKIKNKLSKLFINTHDAFKALS